MSNGFERIEIPITDGLIAGWRIRNDLKRLPYCFVTRPGFALRTYKQMLVSLRPSFDVYAIDLRGHGRTTLPTDPHRLSSWDIYASDVSEFLDVIGRDEWTSGRSFHGRVVSALAAKTRNDIHAL